MASQSDEAQAQRSVEHVQSQSNAFPPIRSPGGSATSDAPPSAAESQEEAANAGGEMKGTARLSISKRILTAMSLRPKGGGVEFPPAHWKAQTTSPENDAGDVTEDTTVPDLRPTFGTANFETDLAPEQFPEPTSFATKIQAMLSTIPPLFSSAATSDSAAASDERSTPHMIKDLKMISFLSSPSVMNGSAPQGRLSVWSALDRLKGRLPGQGSGSSDENYRPLEEIDNGQETEMGTEQADDDASIMLYGPLLPDAGSEVELAQSEVVHDDDKVLETEKDKDTLRRMWPFSRQKSKTPAQSGEERLHVYGSKNKRVWVPSDIKISLEIMWWGYRLYLPPPVLDMLDNKQLEGVKRAALVTTALKWMLDHIPALMVPPNMRPALVLLKGLVPYLGYVGGFVAWSWGYIKKFDKGNGVTLTATWLATVALVPGTWEESSFPKRPDSQVPDETPTPAAEGNEGPPLDDVTMTPPVASLRRPIGTQST